MTTKEKVLELLEGSRSVYLSGEEIARQLEISRAAVWKAVKSLQNEGYSIEAGTNKGYRLSMQTDILSVQGIRKYLDFEVPEGEITVCSSVTSTNALVREAAAQGAAEGRLLLAREQTQGRGRIGRSFFSPKDTGVYFSLLLRPQRYSAEQAARVTTMAAVAVCEAVEEIVREEAKIKWVNDIYLRGKKVCGILTEGSFHLESGLVEYAVLGVGINLYEPQGGFPQELENIAGAVLKSHQDDAKNRFVAQFLKAFYRYYRAADPREYVAEYRRRCFVIGKPITLLSAYGSKEAVAMEIDEDCRLLVRCANGTEERYSSGEISVRIAHSEEETER